MLAGRPPELPSRKQQSWGAMLSIIIIMAMVVLGAYYAFEKRTGAYTSGTQATVGGY